MYTMSDIQVKIFISSDILKQNIKFFFGNWWINILIYLLSKYFYIFICLCIRKPDLENQVLDRGVMNTDRQKIKKIGNNMNITFSKNIELISTVEVVSTNQTNSVCSSVFDICFMSFKIFFRHRFSRYWNKNRLRSVS